MQEKCRMRNILYKWITSKPTKPQRVYMDILEDEWKRRYYNCTKSFRTSVIKMKHHCSYVRKIKNETGQIPTLTWSIVRTVQAYSNTTKKSALYLHEKWLILMYPDPDELLNKHSEIKSRCLHERKYLLSNYDSKID